MEGEGWRVEGLGFRVLGLGFRVVQPRGWLLEASRAANSDSLLTLPSLQPKNTNQNLDLKP